MEDHLIIAQIINLEFIKLLVLDKQVDIMVHFFIVMMTVHSVFRFIFFLNFICPIHLIAEHGAIQVVTFLYLLQEFQIIKVAQVHFIMNLYLKITTICISQEVQIDRKCGQIYLIALAVEISRLQ